MSRTVRAETECAAGRPWISCRGWSNPPKSSSSSTAFELVQWNFQEKLLAAIVALLPNIQSERQREGDSWARVKRVHYFPLVETQKREVHGSIYEVLESPVINRSRPIPWSERVVEECIDAIVQASTHLDFSSVNKLRRVFNGPVWKV